MPLEISILNALAKNMNKNGESGSPCFSPLDDGKKPEDVRLMNMDK